MWVQDTGYEINEVYLLRSTNAHMQNILNIFRAESNTLIFYHLAQRASLFPTSAY